MPDHRTLLRQTADLAADFLDGVSERPVRARATHDELLAAFGGPLPARGEAAGEVVDHLATTGTYGGGVSNGSPRSVGAEAGKYRT